METIFNKKTLAIALTAAAVSLTGVSTLALADEGNTTAPAEPAPATEPAADAAAAPAAAADATKTEEAAPADAAAPATE